MPPMLPICMSTITRSGIDSPTMAITSGPDRASTISMPGEPAVAAISARTVGASLATRMVGTSERLAPPGPRTPRGARLRHVLPERSGPVLGEQEAGHLGQADQVVDVGVEQGHPVDVGRSDVGHQGGEDRLLPVRGQRVPGEILH